MMDYFPLLKWLPYSILGMILFKLNENFDLKILSNESILTNIGKNSLNYYTLHIIVLLAFYKYLSLKE
jgi:fucose 4-O-acetylase-like acetyltransferase